MPRQQSGPRLRTALALAAGSTLLALLCVEGALRITDRIPQPPDPDRLVSQRSEMYQAHPPYGYRLWPSRTMTYDYPKARPRRLTVHANRHGFRSRREFEEPDARLRIAVFGDSMVFGEGVEEEERFTDRLEAARVDWRIDNLGMVGFGPDLMLRALEEVESHLEPDAVVLTMYTDDLRRVRPEYAGVGFPIPRLALRDGELVSVPYPRRSSWRSLRTVLAGREVLWRVSGIEWAINEAVLDRFRANAMSLRFKFVLVFLPGRWDTPVDQQRRTWLRDYAERTGTSFLDLTGHVLVGDSQALFIANNSHLNAAGHTVVARGMERFLVGLSLRKMEE